MKRIAMLVAVVLAACGGEDGGGGGTALLPGDAWCCSHDCDAAAAEAGADCFGGALSCQGGGDFCVQHNSGPACRLGAIDEADAMEACEDEPEGCASDCVFITVVDVGAGMAACEKEYGQPCGLNPKSRCVPPSEATACL